MIYWIIVAVLVSLLIVAVYTTVRFYNSIEVLEARLAAEQSRSLGLKKEAGYWLGMYDNYRKRYETTLNALYNVTGLGTDNMANIGQRMSKAAQEGIDGAKSLPFIKE